MDDIELDPAEQGLERAAGVERQRCRARAWAAGHRNAASEREHRRATVATGALTRPGAVEERRRALAGRRDRPTRFAQRPTRLRGRGDQDPVAALGELAANPGDELVDLVVAAPGVGCHLSDRKALAGGHPPSIGERECAGGR